MRWLLLKDLQILRRSPLLVATLVVYPIVIGLLVGVAVGAGPSKPKVAFLNEVPTSKNNVTIGSERVDASKYASEIFKSIDPIRVKSRAEVRDLVKSGRALAGLIIPKDITERLQGTVGLAGGEGPKVEVMYNADNALKVQSVRSTISSELARANNVLSKRLTKIAANYIGIIVSGGQFSLFGQSFNVLGLRNSQNVIEATIRQLPKSAPTRAALERVAQFAKLASDNLDVSEPILASIGQPIGVKQTVVNGKTSTLNSLVAPLIASLVLGFMTALLAAAMLALEREEQAFGRLVRGLVSRGGLIAEKIGLAGLCSTVVCLLLLCILAVFIGLDWGRALLWIPALAFGALGFAALGVAVGTLAREVRSASLIVFAISLPMAALALVPSGAIAEVPYKIVQVVNLVLPFKWCLQALDAAINDASPAMPIPLLHLAVLTVAFGAIARLAMRRF